VFEIACDQMTKPLCIFYGEVNVIKHVWYLLVALFCSCKPGQDGVQASAEMWLLETVLT